jgi:hypothetical protein
MKLGRWGLDLACIGDGRGVQLADRALRLVTPLRNLNDCFTRFSVDFYRDDTWFCSLITGAVDQPSVDRWVQEPPPALCPPSAWRGERIAGLGRIADHWLKAGSAPAMTDGTDTQVQEDIRFALLQSHARRSCTAHELATLITAYVGREHGDASRMAALDAVRSPLLAVMIPSLDFMTHYARIDQLRHVVIRIAARLERLNLANQLPSSQAEAVARIGPLTVPWDAATIPLTYQRLGDHGFRLFVADTVPPPAGFEPHDWTRLVAATSVAPGRHLVLPGTALDVVVDPRMPPRPAIGTNDF